MRATPVQERDSDSVAQHDSSMHLTIAIDEDRGRTYAKAELRWGSVHLAGVGVAYRHPADSLACEACQERATARALSDLAEKVSGLRRVGA
jgi:hypothetical protein